MDSQPSFGVLVLNQISKAGLERLPAGRYRTGKDIAAPDAILVRSADLHGRDSTPPRVRWTNAAR